MKYLVSLAYLIPVNKEVEIEAKDKAAAILKGIKAIENGEGELGEPIWEEAYPDYEEYNGIDDPTELAGVWVEKI